MRRRRLPAESAALVATAAWLVPRAERRVFLRTWWGELSWHRQMAAAPGIAGRVSVMRLAAGAWRHAWSLATRDWTLEHLSADLAYAGRALRRHWAANLVTSVAAALAFTGAAVTWAARVEVQRAAPAAAARRVVGIETRSDDGTRGGVAADDLARLRGMTDVFASVAAFDFAAYNVTDPVESLPAVLATSNLFEVLGVTPVLGTGWRPEDDDAPRDVVVLTDRLWRRRFGADAAIVGRTIELDGSASYTVAGVLPPGVAYPPEIDLYRAMGGLVTSRPGATRRLWVVAKAADGVSTEAVKRRLSERTRSGARFVVRPLDETLEPGAPIGRLAAPMAALLAIVGVLLMLHRGHAQGLADEPTIALRECLGARPVRLWRPRVLEFVAVALTMLALTTIGSALAGVAPALWSLGSELANPAALAEALPVAALALATAVAIGVARAGGLGLRLAPVLAGGALAAATAAAVAAAGLALIAVSDARQTPGIASETLVTARVAPPWRKYDGRRAVHAVIERMRLSAAGAPGLRGAAAAYPLPARSTDARRSQVVVSSPSGTGPTLRVVRHVVIGPYFDLVGAAPIAGREFTADDTDDRDPVVVLGRATAVVAAARPGDVLVVDGVSRRVVGVVDDTPFPRDEHHVFVPLAQQHSYWMYVIARPDGVSTGTAQAALERAIHAVDPDQGLDRLDAVATIVTTPVRRSRRAAALAAVCAAWALAVGLVAAAVAATTTLEARRRDWAVRVALGAGRGVVVGAGVRAIAWPAALGMTVGAALGWWSLWTLGAAATPVRPAAVAAACLIVLVGLAAVAVRPAILRRPGDVVRALAPR